MWELNKVIKLLVIKSEEYSNLAGKVKSVKHKKSNLTFRLVIVANDSAVRAVAPGDAEFIQSEIVLAVDGRVDAPAACGPPAVAVSLKSLVTYGASAQSSGQSFRIKHVVSLVVEFVVELVDIVVARRVSSLHRDHF